jgi:palmitoyltransferase
MSSTTTQRRKGAAPKSTEGFKIAVSLDDPPPLKAEVKRKKFGTSPFDENWLNLDCCGLFCAFITYCLHIYGIYTVCLILIPPWMSSLDEDGVRSISLMGHFHRLAFTTVAVLAMSAHFKAMTTDPGAVPPDAISPEDTNNTETQNGGETEALNSAQHKRGKRLCRRCNSFKPKRAHHCSVCKRCIIKMDRVYNI